MNRLLSKKPFGKIAKCLSQNLSPLPLKPRLRSVPLGYIFGPPSPHDSHLTAAFEGLLTGVKGCCWTCIAALADDEAATGSRKRNRWMRWMLPVQNCFRLSSRAKNNAFTHNGSGPTLSPHAMVRTTIKCLDMILLISGVLGPVGRWASLLRPNRGQLRETAHIN